MAAVTVSSRINKVWGSSRVVLAKITVVTTGDTWVTGLKKIDSILNNMNAGITATTASGGTITFTGTATNLLVSAIGV